MVVSRAESIHESMLSHAKGGRMKDKVLYLPHMLSFHYYIKVLTTGYLSITD